MKKLKASLRNWLEIKNPELEIKNPESDDLKKLVSSLQRELDFWKQQFSKNAAKKKCTVCKKPINLWPFETEGYYIVGKRVTHIGCKK